MFTSFSTALSALNATTKGLDVIGNNLANLNTTGFKASAVSFQDMVAQHMGLASGNDEVGMGTAPPSVTRLFTQGSIQTTNGSLDAAIQGDGFFVVRDSGERMLFTRAGNFQVDSEGYLLTVSGDRVQGWTAANGILDTGSAISDIQLPVTGTARPGTVTTKMSADLNLNAAAVVDGTDGTWSTPVQVVDSLGSTHVLTLKFTKTDVNTWDYSITIPGEDLTDGEAGTPSEIDGATGTLTFDGTGQLTGPAADAGPINFTVAGLASGADDLVIDWSLYRDDGTPRLTQFSMDSSASAVDQDGRVGGQLTSLTLGDGGAITAQVPGGERLVVAQLALATIRNPESLAAVGNNNLEVSADTAEPVFGTAGTGGRGKILGGTLEGSTSDIAREFTNLIVMQRSYQANARVITTTDEISQETINLKR